MIKTTCKHCGQIIKKPFIDLLEGLEHKKIPYVDGDYSVTSTGLVYSHKRNKFIKKLNYRVNLYTNNVLKSYKVSNLVASMFYNGYETIKDPFVQHKDGNPDNCNIENLIVF